MKSLSYLPGERRALDERARAIVAANRRVVDLIAAGAHANPRGNAVEFLRTADDEQPVALSYDKFMGLLAAAVAWYRAAGIGAQDPVAVLAPPSPATLVAMWAATAAAIANPLNLLFSREAIVRQIEAVGARLLLVPPRGTPGGLHEKVEGIEREVPGLRLVVIPVDGGVAFDGDELEPDADWRTALGSPDAGDPERVSALFPTGGTTGSPKVVRLTNRNMVASAAGSNLAIAYRADDRVLVGLPLFHVGGAFVMSLASFASGATVVIPTIAGLRNPAVVGGWWEIAARHRISVGGLVPTSLGAVAAVPGNGVDLSRLRHVVTGAAPCPTAIERRFRATWGGDAVRQCYGMTELGGAVAHVPCDKMPDGSAVGLPAALVEFAVLADGTLHTEASPAGELLVRGPHLFPGYADARQDEGVFHEGWLRTGDLCRIEPSGQVVVAGRIKDLIIRSGHNVDPVMIEEVATSFDNVGLAGAVGRPDPYAGEVPMLFVAPAAGRSIDVAALLRYLAEKVTDAAARPRHVEVTAELPLTPIGKIFKPRLRELAAEHAARELVGGAAPGTHVQVTARTDRQRGLVLDVVVTGNETEAAAVEAALAQLPLQVDVAVHA